MMLRTTGAGMLLLAGLMTGSEAAALRCDGRIVSEGDRPYDLLAVCGEPDYREQIPGPYLPGIGILASEERWYYNLGPHRFIRVARIRDGRLVDIETAGYGFDDAVIGGRCEAATLDVGMSRLELLARCGEPAYAQRRLKILPPARKRDLPRVVVIDEWTYDLGQGRFVRTLTLIDGEVRNIETGRRS